MKKVRQWCEELVLDLKHFFSAYFRFFKNLFSGLFLKFEVVKKFLTGLLYHRRGKWAQPVSHFFMAMFLFLAVGLAPKIEQSLRDEEIEWDSYSYNSAFAAGSQMKNAVTVTSSHARGEIVEYVVRKGDTVSSIAKKFGVSIDTIVWANNIKSVTKIKVGDRLKVPPVDGIVHRVKWGETVYSVSKKYQANPQAIVDFPFNSFSNDETFALAVGQNLIVPGGIMPKYQKPQVSAVQPQVVPSADVKGLFAWPTSGRITQRYSWYHRGLDIANRSAPPILASRAGIVASVIYGRYGYGKHVIIDHGDGYKTLYAHMSKIYVKVGQSVAQGSAIGQMGSTGRSTGTHLHFEIIKGSAKLDPLSVL